MATVITGTNGIDTPKVKAGMQNIGVVGDRRNLYCSIPTDGTPTATFSADAHILSDSQGFSLVQKMDPTTVDLRISGDGGVVGSLSSEWVAIYHIYNPSINHNSLVAVDLPYSVAAPEVMDPLKLPSGYTHSALAAVLPLSAAGVASFFKATVRERHVSGHTIGFIDVSGNFPTTGNGSQIDMSTMIPLNIKSVDFIMFCNLSSGSVPSSGAMVLGTVNGVDGGPTTYKGSISVCGTLCTGATDPVQGCGTLYMTNTRKVAVFTANHTAGIVARTKAIPVGFSF